MFTHMIVFPSISNGMNRFLLPGSSSGRPVHRRLEHGHHNSTKTTAAALAEPQNTWIGGVTTRWQ